MKITQDIVDNGMRIVHASYDKKDIEAAKKHAESRASIKTDEDRKPAQAD